MIRINPRAFIANWSELGRWDTNSLFAVEWAWSEEVLRPLSEALERRIEPVDTQNGTRELPIIEKISFGGRLTIRHEDQRHNYKGRLFWAYPGNLVFSKIRVKQGSVAIIADDIPQVAVSSEYPVFSIKLEVALPYYLTLVLRSASFKQLLNGLSNGGSSKTRVTAGTLENLLVPLPPLPVQAAIVVAYETGVAEAARLRQEAAQLEAKRRELFRETLGLAELPPMSTSKVLILAFSKLDLWGLQSARSLQRIAGLQQTNYPFLTGEDFLLSVKNGCSDAPSLKSTGLEVLKISAVTKGKLDLHQRKFIADEEAYRRNFDLQAGDVLMCRTNGTLGMVGMSALVEEDLPDMIYPDKVIRLRVNPEVVLPAFLWRALQLPYVRAQIEAAARTAVGNYAIGGADIWALKIPLPPLDIQQELIAQDEQLRTSAQAARTIADETEAVTVARVEEMILGITI